MLSESHESHESGTTFGKAGKQRARIADSPRPSLAPRKRRSTSAAIENRYSCLAILLSRGGRRIEVVYRQDCLERDESLRAEGVSARDHRKPVLAETRAEEERAEKETGRRRRWRRREKERQDRRTRQERVGLGIPNPHLIREAIRSGANASEDVITDQERLDVTGRGERVVI